MSVNIKTQASLFGVYHSDEIERVVIDVLRSGQVASGPYVAKFEASFGELIGQRHVVSLVDMTSAIYMALHLSNVKPGDEVLTTAFACLSTNTAIAQIGATPVWVDVKEHSVEIDLADLESKIGRKTKAVILYHVAGYPGPAKEVAEICKRHGLMLIEDCDNALFAKRGKLKVGSFGDFSVYSFYPNRQINATEGGVLTCKNEDDSDRARKLRRFGIDSSKFRNHLGEIDSKVNIPEIGWSWTMNNLCASIAYTQLSSVKDRHAQTKRNAQKLMDRIGCLEGVELVNFDFDSHPSFWVLLLFVEKRDEVLAHMKKLGVQVSSLHQRNDSYTGFKSISNNQLVNTTYLQDHILGIPCGWWLDDELLDLILNSLQAAIK